MTPNLDSQSTTEPNWEMQSAVSTRNISQCVGKMYVALCTHTCAEKITFVGKDN